MHDEAGRPPIFKTARLAPVIPVTGNISKPKHGMTILWRRHLSICANHEETYASPDSPGPCCYSSHSFNHDVAFLIFPNICHDQKPAFHSAPPRPSLMFRRTALTPKGAHSRDVRLEPLLLGAVRPRGQLDQRVQRDLHPGTLLLRHVHVIRVDTPEHGLVRHDEDILAAFQFHNDRLESDDHVAVGFSAPVAIVVFIVVSRLEVFRVVVRNLLVREAIADARVQLIEGFPFELVVAFWGCGEESSRLVGAFEGGGPDCKLAAVTDGGSDEVGQRTGVELATFRDVGVSPNLAGQVEFGFSMLDGC